MKPACFLLCFFLSVLVMAQPAAPNDKAKPFYDKFLKLADEIKKKDAENAENEVAVLKIMADNAMTQIGHIKKRDPNYDTAPLEAMIKPYIKAQEDAVQKHNDRIGAAVFHNTDEGCYGLFKANTTTEYRPAGNPDEDEKLHTARLEAYNKKLQNILTNHLAGVEACHDYIKDRTETAKKRALECKAKLDKEDSEAGTRLIYREVLGEEAYWNAAKQLYPDIAGAAEVHAMLKNIMTAEGGLEGLLAKAKARKQERLKHTFMPKAVLTNAAVEAEFKEAFANGGWGESIVKINLLSREWTIVRNSLTGAIICRTQQAAIVAKQKKGNCILYIYTIKQSYTGSGYGSVSSYYGHDVVETEFLCENAR